jgi:hypothetical protein
LLHRNVDVARQDLLLEFSGVDLPAADDQGVGRDIRAVVSPSNVCQSLPSTERRTPKTLATESRSSGAARIMAVSPNVLSQATGKGEVSAGQFGCHRSTTAVT